MYMHIDSELVAWELASYSPSDLHVIRRFWFLLLFLSMMLDSFTNDNPYIFL